MKTRSVLWATSLALVLLGLVGCSTSPWDFRENWVIRSNSYPEYSTIYDIIYFNPGPTNNPDVTVLENWARAEMVEMLGDQVEMAVSRPAGWKVRVFSPSLHTVDPGLYEEILSTCPESLSGTDLDAAVREAKSVLKYYFDNYHKKGREYVLLGQGQGALILHEALRRGWFSGLDLPDGLVTVCFAGLPEIPATADRIAYAQNVELIPIEATPLTIPRVVRYLESEPFGRDFLTPDVLQDFRDRAIYHRYRWRWGGEFPERAEDLLPPGQ